ncbi:MAG: hypothetical protein ACRDNI_07915 [Gaiellaceae bacterium]
MEIAVDPAAAARTEVEAEVVVSGVVHWVVVDHPFNAAWYPSLVRCDGEGDPPSYAVVRIEEVVKT